jgi:hypothetical protein
MKLSKLVEVAPSLQTLSNLKLTSKVSYRIAKALNIIKPELEIYDKERVKLAQELGTQSEDGKGYNFAGDNLNKFQTQIQAILDEEISLPGLTMITIDELGAIEIEPIHLAALEGILITD